MAFVSLKLEASAFRVTLVVPPGKQTSSPAAAALGAILESTCKVTDVAYVQGVVPLVATCHSIIYVLLGSKPTVVLILFLSENTTEGLVST